MAKHGERSRGTPGSDDASRREAGSVPDFALVRPYVASFGAVPTSEQHVIPNHHRLGRRSKISVDPPDATATVVHERTSGDFGQSVPASLAGSRRWPRYRPLMLTAGVVFVVATVAAYILGSTPHTPTAESIMPATVPTFAPTPLVSPSPTASSASPKPPQSTRPRPSASGSGSTQGASGPQPPGPSPSTSAVAHTGAIAGVAGLCVDDSAGLTDNGNPIMADKCDGTAGQVWTVEADGTLQVIGKCMQITAQTPGSQVELWDCDGSASEVWRTGSHGSLVNVATGLCLDNPQWKTSGVRLDIADCSRAPSQRWTLPGAGVEPLPSAA